MKIHVNCSLPRSGSELMQCLLAQHPKVYSSITSPLHGIWANAHLIESTQEFLAPTKPVAEKALSEFIKWGTEGYYRSMTDKEVVIDKSRAWFPTMESMWAIFPDAKMICMLRDSDDIINSLETAFKKNPMHPQFRELPLDPQLRREAWLNRVPLSQALEGLRHRQSLGDDSRIIYVSYDGLVDDPINVMNQVFERLELDPFEIDPNKVEKKVFEIDGVFGPLGNHDVRPTIQPKNTPQTSLPKNTIGTKE